MSEEIKSYIWGGISFTIGIVLLYLVGPLNAEVNSNKDEINQLNIDNAIIESEIELGFQRIEERLERIENTLKEMN